MSERKFTDAEWEALENRGRGGRSSRVYSSAVCPRCGRTIREGCYSSGSSNLKSHLKACAKEGSSPVEPDRPVE